MVLLEYTSTINSGGMRWESRTVGRMCLAQSIKVLVSAYVYTNNVSNVANSSDIESL